MQTENPTLDSLVNEVIDRILIDLESADLTALVELLRRVPEPVLRAYLPEV